MTLKLVSNNATIFVTTRGRRFDTYEAGVQGLREEAKRNPWADLELRTIDGRLAAINAMCDLTPVVIEMAGFGPPIWTEEEGREDLRRYFEQIEEESDERPTYDGGDGRGEMYWRDHPHFQEGLSA
jgi:hypothetical protein